MLIDTLRETVRSRKLIPRKSRILIGVSGGADSTALLSLLSALKPEFDWELYAVYVDHRLRTSSAEEAQFVDALCGRLGVPCFIEKADVSVHSRERNLSLEESGRELRYAIFQRLAERFSIEYVALAHHADDQAETVLLRLLRGTGLKGLRAIQYHRPLKNDAGMPIAQVVRPLLNVTKKTILDYLAECNLDYVEDTSNRDWKFTRNRVRHELLPLLREHYNANIDERLMLLAEQLQEDYALVEELAEKSWRRIARVQAGGVVLNLPLFKKQGRAVQRQLVRKAVEYLKEDLNRFEFRHWQEIESLVNLRPEGSIVDLPDRVSVRLDSDHLKIYRAC